MDGAKEQTLWDFRKKAADVRNACLTAPVSKKTWMRPGREFGSDCGKTAIAVRALQGRA